MTVIRKWTEGGDRLTVSEHAEVLIFVGHGEYSWGKIDQLEETLYTFDKETIEGAYEGSGRVWKDMRTLPEEVWKPFEEEFESWGDFIVVKGPLYRIHQAFEMWAGALTPMLDPSGYRPGGDDDYFDYWPSAMEGLKGLAVDLDIMNAKEEFYRHPGFMGVYANVLLDFLVREKCRNIFNGQDWLWEHIPGYIMELSEIFRIPEDEVIGIVCRIATARTSVRSH